MKEATNPTTFAATVSQWVLTSRARLRHEEGWFERFTGDGWVAYWLLPEGDQYDFQGEFHALNRVMGTFAQLLVLFHAFHLPQLIANSANVPAGIGLGFGVDIGGVQLAVIDSDLAIVGVPVVGAVRMACNTQFVVALSAVLRLFQGASLEITERPTKEYPEGQQVGILTLT